MRKKHERKSRKHPTANASIDEEKLEKLEAVKSKREETIAMVKLQLNEKFKERAALTPANMRSEELDHRNLSDQITPLIEKKMIQIREEMKNIMTTGIEKVHAAKILQDKVKFDQKSSTMSISGKKYKLKKNVHVVGWGRDALMMASTFEKIIVNNLKHGLVIVPRRTIAKMPIYPEWFPSLNTRISLTEATSDKTPDETCVRAAKNIADYCRKLKKKDILVVVLSIGGNDLLCLPKGTIGFREKIQLLEAIRDAGASATELGCVRRTLSALRGNEPIDLFFCFLKKLCFGGNLARLAYPAKVISLVMSDAGPDLLQLEDIVDGPTIRESFRSKEQSARSILEKYGLHAHDLSQSIRVVLNDQESAYINRANAKKLDNVDEDDKLFKSVDNFVASSSKDAIDEMAVTAFRLGYVPIKLHAAGSCGIVIERPNVRKISKEYTKILSLLILGAEKKITQMEMYEAMKFSKIFDITEKKILEIFPSKEKWSRGLYVLISPPPIYDNSSHSISDNKTGTNQELSLYFSLDWYLKIEQYPILKNYVVWFLGGASNGHDGNTNYAGAYGYGNLGVDVYRKYKTDISHPSQPLDDCARKLKDERVAIYEAILPDRVLAEGNANIFFRNINDGEELLKLGKSNNITHTNVGNLHMFRIVRCECNCD